MQTPTTHQYTKYQKLYDYYNQHLFNNELPFCLLVLSRAAAQKCGYFSSNRWKDGQGNKTHEISLNPEYLSLAPDIEICQTLVHEMCHLWQQAFGKPSRSGYHNKEWGNKMQEVGLMPSNTGEPGGKRTGQQMADYPIAGGVFLEAFNQMPETLLLPFKAYSEAARTQEIMALIAAALAAGEDKIPLDGEMVPIAGIKVVQKPKKKSKIKYTCQQCQTNAWGKPGLKLYCGGCLRNHFLERDGGTMSGSELVQYELISKMELPPVRVSSEE